MGAHRIGPVSEIPPGQRKIVTLERKSIGVFNVKGTYVALRNACPHQQAPLCRGVVTGTNLPSRPGEYLWAREGEILRCPWHGWEFDMKTGESLFDPHGCRVRTYEVTVEPDRGEARPPSVETYPVSIEDGQIIVHI